MEIRIEEVPEFKENFDERMKMLCFVIKASSFLWHQIRCMIEILFLIGNGFEEKDVILKLLDVEKNPRRPSYAFAADFPLVLANCYYDNLEFKYRMENNMNIYEIFKEKFKKLHIQSILYYSTLKYFANISLEQYINLKNNENLLESLIKDEVDRKTKKNKKKSLMEKPSGNTLEECIANLKGKDKDIYLFKLEKKVKYEEKLQNNKNI